MPTVYSNVTSPNGFVTFTQVSWTSNTTAATYVPVEYVPVEVAPKRRKKVRKKKRKQTIMYCRKVEP